MAKVPDTNTFSLQDVVDVVTPSANTLSTCFLQADAGGIGDYGIGMTMMGNILIISINNAGLISFLVDELGNRIPKDTDDQGGRYQGVFYDSGSSFIYVANYDTGLLSYSADTLGIFTYLDIENTYTGLYDVWSNGNFIIAVADTLGNLTYIDHHYQSGTYYKVEGDDNFIYVAGWTGGLHVYSIDEFGNLNYVTTNTDSTLVYNVFVVNGFIVGSMYSDGLYLFSVDGSGNLSLLDSDDQGGVYGCISSIDNFIYVGNSLGFRTYELT